MYFKASVACTACVVIFVIINASLKGLINRLEIYLEVKWAILRSWLLRNGYWKKNSYISVTELKLQVRLRMQSLHRCTLLNFNFFEEKKNKKIKKNLGDEAKVAQCPFKNVSFLYRMHQYFCNYEEE